MTRPHASDRVAVVVGVLTLALLGFALRPQHTATNDRAGAPVERPRPVEIHRPTALIIGDSYTSGSGVAEISYGCQAVRRMGWLCIQASEPGT